MTTRQNSDKDVFVVLIISVVLCVSHLYKLGMEGNEKEKPDEKKALQWAPQPRAPRSAPSLESPKEGSVLHDEQGKD